MHNREARMRIAQLDMFQIRAKDKPIIGGTREEIYPIMGIPADDELLSRIRAAIAAIGSVRRAHELTGIPVGTLNKYMAGTSMPSFEKVVRIAAAAGVSVGELAGESPKAEVSPVMVAATAEIMRLVGEVVSGVHRAEGAKLPEGALIDEISRAYAALLRKMDNPSDIDEARELLPWLEGRLKRGLREAAAAPGTGKREAS